jgi:aminopeptidase N
LLSNHQPVATEDLLAAFESILSDVGGISGLQFSRAFKTWELQKGYPLITVSFNETGSQFAITQEKYLSITEDKSDEDTSSWYIPLSFTTGANADFENYLFTDYFMDGQAEKTISTASISGFDASQWYIFNIQQFGYYRVNYDDNNWRRIIEILNSDDYDKIHVLNRAQLVDDALTLAFDGVLSYDIALGVVSYLSRETDYIPWYPAVQAFGKLDYILKGRPLHDSFKRFVRILVRRMYVAHGLENSEGVMKQFGRELAIDWTCRMGDQGCLDYAHSQLTEDIPKPLDIALVCNGLKGLDRQEEFVSWYRKFQTASDQSDRLRYLDGLLCSSDPKALKDLLETTIGTAYESFYRSHERSRIYSNIVSRSSVGLQAILSFITSLYDEIVSV